MTRWQAPWGHAMTSVIVPTTYNLQEFRHRVRSAVDHHRDGAMWHFSRDALEEAGARHGPPFAVISSQDMDLSIGRYVAG